jgi:hypothetical protein
MLPRLIASIGANSLHIAVETWIAERAAAIWKP